MTSVKNSPKESEIKQLKDVVSLKNVAPDFCLDDKNLTKSCGMAELKRRMTRNVNLNFDNLTKNVLNQKDTNLCVPLSVSVLLRWAIKEDLKVDDWGMNEYFTVEQILTNLTMVVYPRSLAGLNLNPRKGEKEFQFNDVESILKRIKFPTYLMKSGWDIIRINDGGAKGSFDFEEGKFLLKNISNYFSNSLISVKKIFSKNNDRIYS